MITTQKVSGATGKAKISGMKSIINLQKGGVEASIKSQGAESGKNDDITADNMLVGISPPPSGMEALRGSVH